MAKKSSVENNNKRRRMVENKKATRALLKAKIRNLEIPFEDRIAAAHKLAEMPRNSSRVRVRNRCSLTGRPRGYYRKFGISRIALRELASAGFLPGVTKASW
ncbi:MAG: 30S ribosomal protein S14 [Holosporales bacterium]|jgi:small subunit ribosomal protein S14|nr:30S ribosomal protein S14 [Holosporales bacterium]